jgi:hypothetical protein
MSEDKGAEDELPALFRDDLPDHLSKDLLALAHLSDVEKSEDEEMVESGPIRRSRKRVVSKPYKKSAEEEFQDDMKELDFRTKAWKPFKTNKNS